MDRHQSHGALRLLPFREKPPSDEPKMQSLPLPSFRNPRLDLSKFKNGSVELTFFYSFRLRSVLEASGVFPEKLRWVLSESARSFG